MNNLMEKSLKNDVTELTSIQTKADKSLMLDNALVIKSE